MDLEWLLNFLAWAALFGVGIVPLVISIRVKIFSLRVLSLLLGLFAIFHGLYHLTEAYGLDFYSDVVLEPISVVFLLAFGVYYSRKAVF
ncbi:hypothetical protein J2P12_07240 [Candidatus Bathyarchaeota archaeon]|nr:hypothetical protein [Candidatus Bathyarchaeota archaeon]